MYVYICKHRTLLVFLKKAPEPIDPAVDILLLSKTMYQIRESEHQSASCIAPL
jgi:hypothetical protein